MCEFVGHYNFDGLELIKYRRRRRPSLVMLDMLWIKFPYLILRCHPIVIAHKSAKHNTIALHSRILLLYTQNHWMNITGNMVDLFTCYTTILRRLRSSLVSIFVYIKACVNIRSRLHADCKRGTTTVFSIGRFAQTHTESVAVVAQKKLKAAQSLICVRLRWRWKRSLAICIEWAVSLMRDDCIVCQSECNTEWIHLYVVCLFFILFSSKLFTGLCIFT